MVKKDKPIPKNTGNALKSSQRKTGGAMVVAHFNPGCGKVMPGRRKETKYF
tara:strand:+ start:229 stop:381 length:153 start_codon:yes stop_codon:yes gene_type:complete